MQFQRVRQLKSVPPKLWITDEVVPSFAHIGEQRLDLLVRDSTSDCPDRLTDLKMQNQQQVLSKIINAFISFHRRPPV
jgi:hypothetical protein